MTTPLSTRAPCLVIAKKFGTQAITALKALTLLDPRLRIARSAAHLYLPLLRNPTEAERLELGSAVPSYELAHRVFDTIPSRPKSLAEALEPTLPPHLAAQAPRSMDLIGDVAILEVPVDLWGYRQVVGAALLAFNPAVKTVLAKTGPVDGAYRVRTYEVIAGVHTTETVYREHGCTFHLDPAIVYFSPRLSTERWRVAQQVRRGETVVDMFTGVGAFAIQIAKKVDAVKVHAIDLNPDAVRFLKTNIAVNRVEGRVLPLLGDAGRVVGAGHLRRAADRVIMNLPERSEDFVSAACETIKPDGGIIHFYSFERDPEPLCSVETRFRRAVNSLRDTVEVRAARLVRPTAPHRWQVALDAYLC
jgi:tRNA (guanine37-N1)-methyltransferase